MVMVKIDRLIELLLQPEYQLVHYIVMITVIVMITFTVIVMITV